MLRDIRRSSKDFFSKLTVRKKGMNLQRTEAVSPLVLTSRSEEYSLRVAFLGNQHCGKYLLLS